MQSGVSSSLAITVPADEQAAARNPIFWRSVAKTVFSFPVMCYSLLGMAVFQWSVRNIAEHDIWWHMRNARYFVQNHALPRTDMYSFSAAGSPWLDHEWLSEIVFYLGYRSFGLRGLLAVYFVILMLIFAAVYYRATRIARNCKNAAIATGFAVWLTAVNNGPRLILLGWLCMAMLLIVLDHFRESSKGLWILPPLFALWINLHGSWIYGIAVLIVTIASGLMSGEWGLVDAREWTPAERKQLLLSLAASIAALLVNPFGYKLLLYPFDLLIRQQSNLRHIDEWQSIDFNTNNGRLAMILILGLLAAIWFSRRRWRLDEAALAAFALWGALSHVRLLFFAGLVLMPLLAPYVNLFPPYERQEDKTWLNAVIIVVVIGSLAWFYPSQAKLQQRVVAILPVDAINFMKVQHLTGRVFNSHGWGGYMEWFVPQLKPFVDGRTDIFVYNGVFDDYGKIVLLKRTFELLDKYNIDYVLYEPDQPLSYLLDHSPEWQRIYADPVASVYRRAPGKALPRIPPAHRLKSLVGLCWRHLLDRLNNPMPDRSSPGMATLQ